jgi:hypothetical protein
MNYKFLDFDGVICNSAAELFIVARETNNLLLPKIFTNDSTIEAEKEYFINDLRPYLEFGYEAVIFSLVAYHRFNTTIYTDLSITGDLFTIIEKTKALYYQEFNLNNTKLKFELEKVRTKLIEANISQWLDSHVIYPEVLDFLKSERSDLSSYFIVSTKPVKYLLLLNESFDLGFKSKNIYGLESGSKEDVILPFLTKGSSLFVEDRLATLKRFAKSEEFANLTLLLATWGYLLPTEKDFYDPTARISQISINNLHLLKNSESS